MAKYQTLQNTPITINLDEATRTTGWTIEGNKAYHETCNAGRMVFSETLSINIPYLITIRVNSISGGILRIDLGNDSSDDITTSGFYDNIELTSTTTGELSIYSDAECEIEIFTYRIVEVITSIKQQNTITLREKTNRWISFLTYNPDVGTSLFNNTYVYKEGKLYVQVNQNTERNRFFGTQYDTILKFVSNANQAETKTFQSIAYDSNELLITTEDGITTSLGQVSELIDLDFLKDTLTDGVDEVKIYNAEGIYSAGFMRDKNVDINNGDELKGTYIIVELITTNNNALILKNVQVNSVPSKIGVR